MQSSMSPNSNNEIMLSQVANNQLVDSSAPNSSDEECATDDDSNATMNEQFIIHKHSEAENLQRQSTQQQQQQQQSFNERNNEEHNNQLRNDCNKNAQELDTHHSQTDQIAISFANNNNYQQQQQQQQNNNQQQQQFQPSTATNNNNDTNNFNETVKEVELFGVCIVALNIDGKDRLCLAQISNTLLKEFSYNEIHNRRVALGITCVQCTPIQLELLRRAGAMPSSSRRCGMITMREAERLCRSFLVEEQPPELPENFHFSVAHRVNYGCKGRFIPARYISSRAKCIECFYCGEFYSPNKFIFHSHKQPHITDCNPPDSPNINSWRKHIDLDWTHEHGQEIKYAWEDVKSLFNGGTRRRAGNNNNNSNSTNGPISPLAATPNSARTKSAPNNRLQQSIDNNNNDDDNQLIDVELHEPIVESTPIASSNTKPNWHRQGSSLIAPTSNQTRNTNRNNNNNNLSTGSMATKRIVQQANLHTSLLNKRFVTSSTNNYSSNERADLKPSSFSIAHSQANNNFNRPMSLTTTNTSPQTSSTSSLKLVSDLLAPPAQLCNLAASSMTSSASSSSSTGSQSKSILNDQSYANTSKPIASNLLYSQLYSQLMQPQLHQSTNPNQQLAANFSNGQLDAQSALRHHLWSSLLANLQCNAAAAAAATAANQQTYSLQQQQQQANLAQHCNAPIQHPTIEQQSQLDSQTSFGHLLPTQLYAQQANLASNNNKMQRSSNLMNDYSK